METLRNLYSEDAEVFGLLDRAMKNPPQFPASEASYFAEKSAALHKFWHNLPANSQRWLRRSQLLLRRTLRNRLAPHHRTPQKLTK